MIWFQRVLQKLQYLFLGIVMGLNFFILGSNFKLSFLFSGRDNWWIPGTSRQWS